MGCKIIVDSSWTCKLCYFLLRRIFLSHVGCGQIILEFSSSLLEPLMTAKGTQIQYPSVSVIAGFLNTPLLENNQRS